MNKIEISSEVKYLLYKYLEEYTAVELFERFEVAKEEGINIGKEVLYTLSTQKNFPFESEDKIKIKVLAYHLGI